MPPEKDPRPTVPPASSNAPDTTELPAEAVEKLSPEEQLARYEEALKESDWGHQPC